MRQYAIYIHSWSITMQVILAEGEGGGSLFLWNGLIGRYQQSVEFQSHYVNQKQARIWLHKITDRLTNNPGFLSALDARIHLHLGRKPQCRSIFFDVRDDAACYFVIISCGKRLSTHCPHWNWMGNVCSLSFTSPLIRRRILWTIICVRKRGEYLRRYTGLCGGR